MMLDMDLEIIQRMEGKQSEKTKSVAELFSNPTKGFENI